jgi:hypothetical protein
MYRQNTNHQSYLGIYFSKQEFCIATYTTNAILLISGTTIHSLLGLSIEKNTIRKKSKTIWDN